MDLAGVPQHIVQRGNNRMPCFLDDRDRRHYLHCLQEALSRHEVALHAYALMDNHVHLLLTPTKKGAVSRCVQMFARNYVGWFNVRHGRTGTLWEGRYHSCLVDTDEYLLRCYRYIELNPVRAGIVAQPVRYRWSSFRANAGERSDPLVTPHQAYLTLGATTAERIDAYRAIVGQALSADEIEQIRGYTRQQRALGTDRFQARVAKELQRYAAVRPAHRPARPGTVSDTVTGTVSVSDTVIQPVATSSFRPASRR